MKRMLIGSMVLVLVASPLVALGAIGAVFLSTPNDRPAEFEPIALDTIGSEPREVRVRVVRRDAWMCEPDDWRGLIYVRRRESGELLVLAPNHPRLGCFLEFDRSTGHYQSWCHNSRFDVDGRFLPDPKFSYPMVDMRRLEYRVDGNELIVAVPRKWID